MTTVDDAFIYIVATLKARRVDLGHNGYDVYTDHLIRRYLVDEERLDPQSHRDSQQLTDRAIAVSPLFFAALWELCRRGILRPGMHSAAEMGVGSLFGAGYCITPFGQAWLSAAEYEQLAAAIPSRFVELLTPYQSRFGQGFLFRAVEAIRCYNGHAFLGCCAMCGAAAESVLLALAIEQKPEATVLAMYRRASGRKDLEKLLVGAKPDHIKREFDGYLSLLTYWRNEAAHGQQSDIGDTEAFVSLTLLLRFARFADESF